MSYGLVLCGLCKRPRVVDMGHATTTCPYCNYSEKRGKARCVFESESQSEVRTAMARGSGAEGEMPTEVQIERRKRRIEEADPYSTMVYRYEHASDMDERMSVLAEGLTKVKGEFTLSDVEEVVGKRAEKMLSAMLDQGYVIETRPGFYKG